MGNRAVITLDQTPTINSLGIYLHWNGGAESVLAFAQAAHDLGALERLGEEEQGGGYAIARLVQIIGNFFGGTLSLGVSTLGYLDHDNNDNGLFVIQPPQNGQVTLKQYPRGLNIEARLSYPPRTVNRESVSTHPYWNDPETGEKDAMLTLVKQRNADPFGEWKEDPVRDAAPDLLAQLQYAASILETHVQYDDDEGSAESIALEGARAAIAKATATKDERPS